MMNNSASSQQKFKWLYGLNQDKNLMRLLIILVFVFILMSLLKPNLFLTSGNFISMAKQFPEYGLLAIAISIAMITGGIDLSVVAIANLSAIVAAKFYLAYLPADAPLATTAFFIIAGVFIALIVGSLAGAFNGLLISKFKISAILATLGTYQLFSGIAVVLTEGKSISGLPMAFSTIGNYSIFGSIPVPFVIFIVMAIIVGILLSKTTFGTQLYLFGTNEKAAHYAGLNNTWIIIRTYVLAGFLSALAGLIMMARTNSINADYGSNYTLQCILIAVLGGINPKGGFGNIQGIVVAILILQILSSGLNMFPMISNFYRDIIWGGVLIFVLIFNYYIFKREQKLALKG